LAAKCYDGGMQSSYAHRIAFAGAFSLVAHALMFAVLSRVPPSPPAEVHAAAPVRLTLAPPPEAAPPDAPRRLVDVTAEAAPPERPTDLIAEVNARAQDMAVAEDEVVAPRVDEVAEYERVAALPPASAVTVEPTPTPPSPREPVEPIESLEVLEPEPVDAAPEPPAPESPSEEAAGEAPRREPEPSEPARPEQERTEVAQAPPVAQTPPITETPRPRAEDPAAAESERPSGSAGRLQGAVLNKGFLGFEAMQDDIAPYLRHVQERVERRWRLSMELEYRGARRARAVIDCAIQPNGELRFVRIHDDGGNPAYAAACANAIRRAAPFDAFPFETPALYRDEEIQIRWTFQFM